MTRLTDRRQERFVQMTVAMLRDIDRRCDQLDSSTTLLEEAKPITFFQHLRMATVDHEDNRMVIRRLAALMGIHRDSFAVYVCLHAQILEAMETGDEAVAENVLGMLSMDRSQLPDLEEYILAREVYFRHIGGQEEMVHWEPLDQDDLLQEAADGPDF